MDAVRVCSLLQVTTTRSIAKQLFWLIFFQLIKQFIVFIWFSLCLVDCSDRGCAGGGSISTMSTRPNQFSRSTWIWRTTISTFSTVRRCTTIWCPWSDSISFIWCGRRGHCWRCVLLTLNQAESKWIFIANRLVWWKWYTIFKSIHISTKVSICRSGSIFRRLRFALCFFREYVYSQLTFHPFYYYISLTNMFYVFES